MTIAARRPLPYRQAQSMITRVARDRQAQLQECIREAKGPGLITSEGYLQQCGTRFYLAPICDCLEDGQPQADCEHCRGTGRA